jgi:hypothetical protein
MSSQRKPQGRPAGGPPPERKAPAGPMLTPQVLMVIFFLVIAIGIAVWYNQVVKAGQAKVAAAEQRVTTADANIKTYRTKGGKLPVARELNTAVREKLHDVSYMFMTDQTSVMPFWEETFFPVLTNSRLQQTEDSKIKVETTYEYQLNMAMDPFNTIPGSSLFDAAWDVFDLKYHPEQNGQPVDQPLDTRPADFLSPYTFKLEKWGGTYEDVKDFIRQLQVKQDKTLFTVHCFKNTEDKNIYGYRTSSQWDIFITVYFVNPEANANGDTAPAQPGSESC